MLTKRINDPKTPDHKTPLLLIGGGGHCASVIDVVESTEQYHIVGIVEAKGVKQTEFMGYPIVGTDDELEMLIQQTPHCLITVGQLKTADLRKTLFDQVLALGGLCPVIVSPFARVATQAKVGAGTVIMHFALVNSQATVGDNCIINSYASVEHGSQIGKHGHLSTRATINGDCQIGDGCFIGSAATVLQGKSIASGSVIGAGALVTKDLIQAGLYIGSPAKNATHYDT